MHKHLSPLLFLYHIANFTTLCRTMFFIGTGLSYLPKFTSKFWFFNTLYSQNYLCCISLVYLYKKNRTSQNNSDCNNHWINILQQHGKNQHNLWHSRHFCTFDFYWLCRSHLTPGNVLLFLCSHTHTHMHKHTHTCTNTHTHTHTQVHENTSLAHTHKAYFPWSFNFSHTFVFSTTVS